MAQKRYILDDYIQPQQQKEQIYNPITQSTIGRNVSRGVVDTVANIGGLPRTAQDIVTGLSNLGTSAIGVQNPLESLPKLPSREDIRGGFEKGSRELHGKDLLSPQGPVEEGIDRAISQIPGTILAAATGVPLSSALLMAGGGVVGGEIAKALGFGETGQALGEIAGSLTPQLGIRGAKAVNILKSVDSLKKKSLHDAEKIASKSYYPTESLRNGIEKSSHGILTTISDRSEKRARKEVNGILKKLYGDGGNSTVENIVKAHDSVDDILQHTKSEKIREFFESVQNQLSKELSGPIAEKFPDFYGKFNAAKTIQDAQNIQGAATKLFKTGPLKKVPEMVSSATSLLISNFLQGPQKTAALGSAYGALKVYEKSQIIKKLMSVPEISQSMRQLGRDILSEQPQLVLNRIQDIDKLVRDTSGPESKPRKRYILD